MKTSLLIDFIVDKENSTVKVKREFNAPISKVWAAWTDSKILDKWWAPKPWQARTKFMSFIKGGYWLYAMLGPNGDEHWARADFKAITPKLNFKVQDAFCDDKGNINNDLPRSEWNVDFNETGRSETVVNVTIKAKNQSDMEKLLDTGFKEGFTMALENLDELLLSV